MRRKAPSQLVTGQAQGAGGAAWRARWQAVRSAHSARMNAAREGGWEVARRGHMCDSVMRAATKSLRLTGLVGRAACGAAGRASRRNARRAGVRCEVQEWRWGGQGEWVGCVQSAAGASGTAAWVALKRPRAPKCVAAPTIVGAGIIIRRPSS